MFSENELGSFTAKVSSNEGFYIGDLSYALNEDYVQFWVEQKDFTSEKHTVDKGSFAVSQTPDTCVVYVDDQGNEYNIEIGALGIVPKELAKDTVVGARFFPGAGDAIFSCDKGKFRVKFPDGTGINLNVK